MPSKQELLQQIQAAIESDQLTPQEIRQAIRVGKDKGDRQSGQISLLTKTLSILGGGVILLGLIFLFGIIWPNLNAVAQVLVTLGFGLVTYFTGIVFLNRLLERFIGLSVSLLGIIFIPIGSLVTLNNLGITDWSEDLIAWVLIVIFAVLAAAYAVTDRVFKSNLFTAATIIFANISYAVFTVWFLAEIARSLDLLKLEDIETLVRIGSVFAMLSAGILIWLGRRSLGTFREKAFKFFEGVGYASLFYSFFTLVMSTWFEVLALVLFVAAISLGARLRSYTLITWGFIATTAYIMYVNVRYFADTLSWPIALMLSGVVLLVSGTLLSRAQKKIRETKQN